MFKSLDYIGSQKERGARGETMDLKKTLVGIVVTGLGATAAFTGNPTFGTVVGTVGVVILIDGALEKAPATPAPAA